MGAMDGLAGVTGDNYIGMKRIVDILRTLFALPFIVIGGYLFIFGAKIADEEVTIRFNRFMD